MATLGNFKSKRRDLNYYVIGKASQIFGTVGPEIQHVV